MSSANAGSVLAIVGTAAAINAVAVTRKRGPAEGVGVLFGGVAMFGTLAALGQFYDWRMARGMALLLLLGTVLLRGESTSTWLTSALDSFKTGKE